MQNLHPHPRARARSDYVEETAYGTYGSFMNPEPSLQPIPGGSVDAG